MPVYLFIIYEFLFGWMLKNASLQGFPLNPGLANMRKWAGIEISDSKALLSIKVGDLKCISEHSCWEFEKELDSLSKGLENSLVSTGLWKCMRGVCE